MNIKGKSKCYLEKQLKSRLCECVQNPNYYAENVSRPSSILVLVPIFISTQVFILPYLYDKN